MPTSAKRNFNNPNIATKNYHIHKSEFTKHASSKVNCVAGLIEQLFEFVDPYIVDDYIATYHLAMMRDMAIDHAAVHVKYMI